MKGETLILNDGMDNQSMDSINYIIELFKC